jgi:hypothetical protein
LLLTDNAASNDPGDDPRVILSKASTAYLQIHQYCQ